MRSTLFRGRILFLAGLFALATTPALAQNLVRGTVVDAQDKPVEGATITFEAIKFVNKRDTKTGRKGEFIFQGLQSGEYTVTATKEGVGTQVKTTTISSTSALEPLKFALTPAASAGPAGPLTAGGLTLGAAPANPRDKEVAAIQASAAAAMEAYKAGRFEESAKGLAEVIVKLPSCGDCFLYLGNSYYSLKKLDEAEAALKKSIEVAPSVEGYTALTRIYNQQKKFDLAAEMSQKATDLTTAPAPLAAGAPASPASGAKPAAGAAGAAPAAAPAAPPPSANSETLYNQGVVLWNAGKYAEAKAQFEASVKANPGNAEALYQLGMANLNLGELPQARAAFEGYLKAAPDGPKAAEVKTFIGQLPK